MQRERAYRGISLRLAREYLERLGGDSTDESLVTGDGWRATLSAETVSVGPSLELTEVTVVFEGEAAAVEAVLERFSQKAMRAGG
ncbi:hypothetical protein [Natronobiforma cellulositropha]|uniref:hypothetical protein n=1 Tax=Natronobiforma cellulositropha TaxID=1679076 RepID=UPI003CCDB514